MNTFVINGGKPLKGIITVKGAKNAATPILATTLLTKEECIIDNIPKIKDVLFMIEILESMGAKTKWINKDKLSIKNDRINFKNMDTSHISKMRSSILLIGPLLSRFKEVKTPKPGGCHIGTRPIEPHLRALQELGAKISKRKNLYQITTKGLTGNEFTMSEFSVTATENSLMAAVLAKGTTTIHCAASDIYIQDLAKFLNKLGAKIQGIGTHTLKIKGVKKLHGAKHKVAPDPIETGTFISLAAATKSKITIKNFKEENLRMELEKYKEAGLKFKIDKNSITVYPSNLKAIKVHNMPAPGFTADLIQPFAAMMTQAKGTSLIHDWMYEGRQRYTRDLNNMGANCFVCDPHRVLITGPTPLEGKEVTSHDLRAGATLLVAALAAKGKSLLHQADQIDRGYEDIENRLQTLGADIKRV